MGNAHPFHWLFLAALVAGVVGSAAISLILLLSHPKTRRATWTTLGVLAICLLTAVFSLIGSLRFTIRPTEKESPSSKTAIDIPYPGGDSAAAETPPKPLPQPSVDVPKDRPDWIEAPAKLDGDVYRVSVMVGPFTTRAECEEALPEAVQKTIDSYADAYLTDQGVGDVRLPPDELRQLVKQRWEEVRQYTVGPMTQIYALLEFDGKVRGRILELHREAVVNRRLQAVAGASALVFVLLAGAFAYLKIDLATGGLYRGRLRFVAAIAILVVGAAAVAAKQWLVASG